MNVDMKYVVGILLLVLAFALFWTARIDLPTFLGMVTAALAVMGYTAYTARRTVVKT